MILVTLGTQNQKFYRLLDAIENSKLDDEIIVQAGGSVDYKSKKMKLVKFMSYDEMEELVKKADFIITHAGTGSILTALRNNKKVIACARLSKYKEHINDHQIELANSFKNDGYILELTEESDLDVLVKELKKFKPKKYESNKKHFIEELKKIIDN